VKRENHSPYMAQIALLRSGVMSRVPEKAKGK